MGGGLFGGGSKPTVTKAPEPTVAATAPPPEETAEAPVIDETSKRKQSQSQRRGTSALRINLNIGGGNMGGGTSGLSIPR